MIKKYAFYAACLIIIFSWSKSLNPFTSNEDACIFVQDVYLGVLGRPADPSGLKNNCDLLKLKKIQKHELIRSFIESEEFKSKGK